MNKKFKVCVLVVSLMVSSSVSPISEKWVIPGTLASALGGGASGYFFSHNNSNPITVLSILAGTAGSAMFANWLLYRFTPQGCHNRAVNKINAAVCDGFVNFDLSKGDEYKSLKQYCKSNYDNDWYLVSGKMRLNALKSDLISAWSLLNSARKEAGAVLAAQCDVDQVLAEDLKSKVQSLLDLIDSDSTEYYRHRSAYDAHLARTRQMPLVVVISS